MSEKLAKRRLIVLVDGVIDHNNIPVKGSKSVNASSLFRLRHSIKNGRCQDGQGRNVHQEVHYHQAVLLGNKFMSKSNSPSEQQIQDIVLNICKGLETPDDEIYLFASGYGAYTVRAVSGVLHHMGIPRPGHLKDFAELYQNALDLIKARQTDDSIKGHIALEYLRSRTSGAPNIRFMGLLDAIKTPADRQSYDTSIVTSIQNFRHAMAFNETRSRSLTDMPSTPTAKEMQGRSFIQAWFLGYNPDLVGGTHQDGLSVYPLQWLLVEAMLLGLVAHYGATEKEVENPLALLFPQYTGSVPKLDGTEKIQWKIRYANNITVNMFDIHSIHMSRPDSEEPLHAIHFENVSRLKDVPRKIFAKDGTLLGYNSSQTYGTIIHPSVFCIIDRNQRLLEQNRFKPYKENLANFEVNCLRSDSDTPPPWLEESQLLASGVKAFRILVCGKTGVGKSTLINKVFGVEMTEESNTYSQGVHDINKAFESPNHPGLLIHDSRGWQAGSDQELDLIAQFLRHRAFQKEPAEALHVIWFCVDSDVSRIEEADKRTFETIAQYSNHVPVFVVGTKKDKLVAYRKGPILHQYMQKTNNYNESDRLASLEADKLATEQFLALKDQLSQIRSYKADGYVCLSKDDEAGVKNLLTQTLDMIVDDRVRLFCVAAQVVDVNSKIDSALTECMRLGTHAIRTAMVPLPFSGIIGTPTVSRIICEHVLQCFGFPKAMPEEVEEVMSRIVLGNLKQFMTVTLTQFLVIGSVTVGAAIGTMGIGAILGLASSMISTPPTARMLLKCSCDMILILERSFRYNGKYVSVKQIEDAAKQYTNITTTTFGGKTILLQEHVHNEVDRLVPLAKVGIGFRFNKLRTGFEHIVYKNRYDRPPEYEEQDPLAVRTAELNASISEPPEFPSDNVRRAELSPDGDRRAELPGTSQVAELDNTAPTIVSSISELPASQTTLPLTSRPAPHSESSEMSTMLSPSTTISRTKSSQADLETPMTEQFGPSPMTDPTLSAVKGPRAIEKSNSDGSSFLSKMGRSMKFKKSKSTS